MKLVNPLYYPLAVLAGGIVLFAGVRLANLPSAIALPVAVAVAAGGAAVQKSREPASLNLANPALETELQSARALARTLANKASELRAEALKLLGDSSQIELLGAVQYACDRASELPVKIDRLIERFQGADSLLSAAELERQLAEVRQRQQYGGGLAQEQLQKLAASLQRSIQLARTGEDARQAQVLSLRALIVDSGSVLQELQNKLRSADLSNSEQTRELRSLSDELKLFQENVEILVSR